MSTAIIAIFSMYFFIIIGFMAKKFFHEDMNSKTLNLLSVYFLQPFLTFWGLTQRPIDASFIQAPLWYLAVIFTIFFIFYPIVQKLFDNPQERSIASIAALLGNTGNLGIPLGIAIFGLVSVPIMTLINLMNVFVVYTFGVYIYSRGHFSVKKSLLNIVKLPILWFAVLAIIFNINEIAIHDQLSKMLEMGAYASMVVQLLLFGMYLQESTLHRVSRKLLVWVMSMKFLIMPLLTFALLLLSSLSNEVKAMIFMELFMPLAVANINIASLFKCHVSSVTVLVFFSSILFLILMFAYLPLINYLYI
jgi:malate permease and related proteins